MRRSAVNHRVVQLDIIEHKTGARRKMTTKSIPEDHKREWVEPEIRELDVKDTLAAPRGGADVGGNPYPDCQRS
jgi:hypothetical protein